MAVAATKNTGAGLECLQHLTVVRIHQKTKFGSNKYMVNTVEGEVLFTLKEDGGALAFLSDGQSRGFHMEAVDSQGRQAFIIRRPRVFSSDKVEVSIGGQVVSIVRKVCTLMKPIFSVNNAMDVPMLRVKGGFSDYEYQLQTPNKTPMGSISKKFRGLMKEMFTDADDYEITFPVDLDLRYKSAVIAACILIDYRYHEN